MKTQWSKELCSVYPKMFEQLNKTTYIQRRNIQEYTGEGGGYECESRMISEEVYEALQEEYSSPTYQAMERANAMLLLRQASLAATQNDQDATLALILKNTVSK